MAYDRSRASSLYGLALCCSLAGFLGCEDKTPADRVVLGRVENVYMQDVGMKLKARIDSGAGVSAIAAEIVQVERTPDDKAERVTFKLSDNLSETRTVRRTIVDWIEIKVKGANTTVRRPIVLLDICLGGKKIEGRFSLADRTGFLYPVLVGRNILKTGDFLIDPKRKFIEHADCR